MVSERERQRKELDKKIVEVFGLEEAERMHATIVQRGREYYSDDEFWDKLFQSHELELRIVKQLPIVYHLAHNDDKERDFWQSFWNRMITKRDAEIDIRDCYAWHLEQRGDTYVRKWLEECVDIVQKTAVAATIKSGFLTHRV